MLIVLGPQGGFNWNQTASYYKENYEFLYKQGLVTGIPGHGKRTFEATSGKEWYAFKCLDCTRILPVDAADLDHISPKSNLKFGYQASPMHYGSRTIGWSWTPDFTICMVNPNGGKIGILLINQKGVMPILVDFTTDTTGYINLDKKDLKGTGFQYEPPKLLKPAMALPAAAAAAPPVAPLLPPGAPKSLKRHSVMEDWKTSAPKKVPDVVILPIAEVVKNDLENLMLLCGHCNRSKSNN